MDNSKEKYFIHLNNIGKGAFCDVLVSVVDKFDQCIEVGIFGAFHPGGSDITLIELEKIKKALAGDTIPEICKVNLQYVSHYNKTRYSQNFVITTEIDVTGSRVVKNATPTMRTEIKKS